MKTRINLNFLLAVGVLALGLADAARAQTKLQPGLWEHSFTVQDSSGHMAGIMKQMQDQMAQMSPAQRQQMEQMMAGKGISIGGGAGGASAVKMCMTQAQVELNEVPQSDKNCTHQVMQRTGNTIKIKFSCPGNPPASGEGEVTILSPTSYKGKSTVNTAANGKPERMTMEQTGKWLSADCGDIKPIKK